MGEEIHAPSDDEALFALASLSPDSPVHAAMRAHFEQSGQRYDVVSHGEDLPHELQRTRVSVAKLLTTIECGHTVSAPIDAPPLCNATMMTRRDVPPVLQSERMTFGEDGAYGRSEINTLASDRDYRALTFCIREEPEDFSGGPQAAGFWRALCTWSRRSRPREDFRDRQKLVPVGYAIFQWREEAMNVLTAGIFEGHHGKGYGQGIVASLLSRTLEKGKGLDFDREHTFLCTFARMQGYCDTLLEERTVTADAFARGIRRIARCLDDLPDGRFKSELRHHFAPAFETVDDGSLSQRRNALSRSRNSLVALIQVFGSRENFGTDALQGNENLNVSVSRVSRDSDGAKMLRRMVPTVQDGDDHVSQSGEELLVARQHDETVGVVSYVSTTTGARGQLLVPVRYGKAHGDSTAGIEPALAAALLETCRNDGFDGIFHPHWLRDEKRRANPNAGAA